MLVLAHFLAMVSAVTLTVSPTGNDANSGLTGHPLQTLNGARIAARRYPHQPVVVEFSSGTYRQTKPVKFENADSGDRTYRSKAGQLAVLSGSQAFVPLWRPFKGPILQCETPAGFEADQLFINGERQILARYPNEDLSVRILHGYAADAIDPSRFKRWKDPKGGYLHAMHAEMWGDFHYRISGKSSDGGLDLVGGWQNNRRMGMHPLYRFVEGIFEELDSPGEYFFDVHGRTLYYYPRPKMKLTGTLVEGVSARGLIEIDGAANLKFEGLKFQHTARTFMENREPLLRSDWTIYRGGAVHFKNAKNCEVVDCILSHLGGNAVFVDGRNSHIAVRQCEISNCGANAVAFVGSPSAVRNPLFEYEQRQSLKEIDPKPGPRTDEYPDSCVVEDCVISHVGEVEKQSAGVQIAMSAGIVIRHCSIWHTPRAGINIGDGCWGGHVIEGCDVFDTVLETGDHGSFNSWGRDRYWGLTDEDMNKGRRPDLALLDTVRPIVLRNNRWRCDHGWDIDLDDGASNYVIENNVCLHGGLKNREGFYRKVRNNILVGNSFHPHVWFLNSGDEFTSNIVFEPYHPIGVPKPWGEKVDNNLLHVPGQFTVHGAAVLADLSGRDAESMTGDARFENPGIGDFRVHMDSPALALGFRNFDMSSFGVRLAKLKRIAAKPLLDYQPPQSLKPAPEQSFWGATVKELTDPNEMSAVGLGERGGVLVVKVPQGSIAASIGIRSMDVIRAIDSKGIRSIPALIANVHGKTRFDLHVWRSQMPLLLPVQL